MPLRMTIMVAGCTSINPPFDEFVIVSSQRPYIPKFYRVMIFRMQVIILHFHRIKVLSEIFIYLLDFFFNFVTLAQNILNIFCHHRLPIGRPFRIEYTGDQRPFIKHTLIARIRKSAVSLSYLTIHFTPVPYTQTENQ
jgi:hypothetical protein